MVFVDEIFHNFYVCHR